MNVAPGRSSGVMDNRGIERRRLCVGLALSILGRSTAAAAAARMPAGLQADLLAKLAPYDRGLRARAGDTLQIAIVTKSDDPDSERNAAQLTSALHAFDRIAGLAHAETTFDLTTPAALLDRCKESRAAIVYVSDQLEGSADAIRGAFDGHNVLTVAPSAELVRRAVVLGFDLVGSKPKLFFNATIARRQGIAIASEVLKLMTVYT